MCTISIPSAYRKDETKKFNACSSMMKEYQSVMFLGGGGGDILCFSTAPPIFEFVVRIQLPDLEV